MPVLMNKGTDPHQAAWLFYTARPMLDELGRAIERQRFDAGRITVDADELAATKKAGATVHVYLDVMSVVPDDFDLEGALAQARAQAQEAAESTAQQAAQDGAADEAPAAGDDAGDKARDAQAAETASVETAAAAQGGAPDADPAAPGAPALPYEPIALDEPIRVEIGLTTAQAARTYLAPDATDERDGAQPTELPGLQALAQLIGHMRDSSFGVPTQAVWHIDAQGILRMAPAKTVKPMAGNVLKVKL